MRHTWHTCHRPKHKGIVSIFIKVSYCYWLRKPKLIKSCIEIMWGINNKAGMIERGRWLKLYNRNNNFKNHPIPPRVEALIDYYTFTDRCCSWCFTVPPAPLCAKWGPQEGEEPWIHISGVGYTLHISLLMLQNFNPFIE